MLDFNEDWNLTGENLNEVRPCMDYLNLSRVGDWLPEVDVALDIDKLETS